MGTYIGMIEIKGKHYNYRPIERIVDDEIIQIESEELEYILPRSDFHNLVLSYSNYYEDERDFMKFDENSVVPFDFELEDLEENPFRTFAGKDQKGYRTIKNVMTLYHEGKRKDQEFSDLMNCEISSIEDVKKVYKTANSLIEFYNGADDNLEDVKLMSQEALLLREAYIKINDNSLSITKIKSVAESEKKRIGNVLDGNSIFDDDVVIDEFLSKRKKEIEKTSSS